MTTKVKLRQKPISGNRQTLYLDFYPAIITNPETGETTRREFLNLFIFDEFEHEAQTYKDEKGNEQKRIVQVFNGNEKPKRATLSPLNKKHNEQTLQLAEQIRQKRENELNKPEVYNDFEKERLKIKERGEHDFVEYFRRLAGKRVASNQKNWASALKYVEKFTGGKFKFADLNEQFCEGFKEYLLTTKSNKSDKVTLSTNSAVSYFNKVKAVLRQAYKDGYLQTDLNAKVKPIEAAETQRQFLTVEELNRLVKTECNNQLLKSAALFSALTGLRFSDIKKLTWGEVEHTESQGYYLRFTQQKTGGAETLPISEQAASFMGERRQPGDNVFEGLTYSAYHNKHLFQWLGAAGITKNITFHCFRHTFATLQLENNTDIYTISKMLGHKNLRTTQVYAHLVDKLKRAAADKIKLDL